jgi:hypothetical protein
LTAELEAFLWRLKVSSSKLFQDLDARYDVFQTQEAQDWLADAARDFEPKPILAQRWAVQIWPHDARPCSVSCRAGEPCHNQLWFHWPQA